MCGKRDRFFQIIVISFCGAFIMTVVNIGVRDILMTGPAGRGTGIGAASGVVGVVLIGAGAFDEEDENDT